MLQRTRVGEPGLVGQTKIHVGPKTLGMKRWYPLKDLRGKPVDVDVKVAMVVQDIESDSESVVNDLKAMTPAQVRKRFGKVKSASALPVAEPMASTRNAIPVSHLYVLNRTVCVRVCVCVCASVSG